MHDADNKPVNRKALLWHLGVLSKDICPINMHEFVRRACMAG